MQLRRPGASFLVTDTGNDFNRFAADANYVSVRDNNALKFATSSIGADLTATAPGGISQVSGSHIVVNGTALFRINPASVVLGEAANDFATVRFTNTQDATVTDTNAVKDSARSL